MYKKNESGINWESTPCNVLDVSHSTQVFLIWRACECDWRDGKNEDWGWKGGIKFEGSLVHSEVEDSEIHGMNYCKHFSWC